jgi:hypothetical protein
MLVAETTAIPNNNGTRNGILRSADKEKRNGDQ